MRARGQFVLDVTDRTPVVQVNGDVDLSNVRDLEAALEEAARMGSAAVIVSLAHTTYLDSQGIRVLLRVAERLRATDQRLLVVAPAGGGVVRRILEITGVPRLVPLFETVEDAMRAAEG